MARNRASMREGPLAELFRATEAAQRASTEPAADDRQQQIPVEVVAAPEPKQPRQPRPNPVQIVGDDLHALGLKASRPTRHPSLRTDR